MLFSKNCLTFTDSENSSPERAVVISLSPPHINVFFSNLLLLFIVDMLLKLITNNWLSCTNLLSSHSTWPTSNAVAGDLPEHTMQRRRVEASRSSCFALQLDAQTEQSGIATATPTTTIVTATATTTTMTAAISANCGIVVGVAVIASKLRLPPDRSSSRNRRGEGGKESREGERRESREVESWDVGSRQGALTAIASFLSHSYLHCHCSNTKLAARSTPHLTHNLQRVASQLRQHL